MSAVAAGLSTPRDRVVSPLSSHDRLGYVACGNLMLAGSLSEMRTDNPTSTKSLREDADLNLRTSFRHATSKHVRGPDHCDKAVRFASSQTSRRHSAAISACFAFYQRTAQQRILVLPEDEG